MGLARNVLSSFAKPLGYRVVRAKEAPPADHDLEPEFKAILKLCAPFTMTSQERMYALWQSVRYAINRNIPGDFVECGVWKGGSAMLIAHTLKQLNALDRTIWLYDTFEGMSTPTEKDVRAHDGEVITPQRLQELISNDEAWKSLAQPLDAVKAALASTGYPADRLKFIKGKVEQTIPAQCPDRIALLRLDTDWYESTRHELVHLYPRLQPGAPLIIDDYGYWQGARDAVDEYLKQNTIHLLLNRIDQTGRLAIKP